MTGAPVRLDGRPQLLDPAGVHRATIRLAHEIIEHHDDLDGVLLIGIRTRGVPLARRISSAISNLTGRALNVCAVDVTGFRDDRPRDVAPPASPLDTDAAELDVTDRSVILIDDVIFTGRTVRAAIDAVMSQGRPRSVEVLVLVDRGHRELPVRPTYVGKNVPTTAEQRVTVRLREIDELDGAWLVDEGAA